MANVQIANLREDSFTPDPNGILFAIVSTPLASNFVVYEDEAIDPLTKELTKYLVHSKTEFVLTGFRRFKNLAAVRMDLGRK